MEQLTLFDLFAIASNARERRSEVGYPWIPIYGGPQRGVLYYACINGRMREKGEYERSLSTLELTKDAR